MSGVKGTIEHAWVGVCACGDVQPLSSAKSRAEAAAFLRSCNWERTEDRGWVCKRCSLLRAAFGGELDGRRKS